MAILRARQSLRQRTETSAPLTQFKPQKPQRSQAILKRRFAVPYDGLLSINPKER